jgi:hypothetical protein
VVYLWIKLCALAKDAREDVSEDGLLPDLVIVSKRQAMLEAAFGVGADQVRESCNDKLTHICAPLQGSHFLATLSALHSFQMSHTLTRCDVGMSDTESPV